MVGGILYSTLSAIFLIVPLKIFPDLVFGNLLITITTLNAATGPILSLTICTHSFEIVTFSSTNEAAIFRVFIDTHFEFTEDSFTPDLEEISFIPLEDITDTEVIDIFEIHAIDTEEDFLMFVEEELTEEEFAEVIESKSFF